MLLLKLSMAVMINRFFMRFLYIFLLCIIINLCSLLYANIINLNFKNNYNEPVEIMAYENSGAPTGVKIIFDGRVLKEDQGILIIPVGSNFEESIPKVFHHNLLANGVAKIKLDFSGMPNKYLTVPGNVKIITDLFSTLVLKKLTRIHGNVIEETIVMIPLIIHPTNKLIEVAKSPIAWDGGSVYLKGGSLNGKVFIYQASKPGRNYNLAAIEKNTKVTINVSDAKEIQKRFNLSVGVFKQYFKFNQQKKLWEIVGTCPANYKISPILNKKINIK